MSPRHLALGNINIDMYLYVDRLPGPDEELPVDEALIAPGGAASNYAVAVARAGHEVFLAAHTSRVAEALGVLEELRSRGVRLDHVIVHPDGLPGLVVIVVARGGETVMFKIRGVNALLRGDEAPGDYDVVHVASAEPQVLERAMSVSNARLYSYDPGGAVALRHPSSVAALLDRVDILSLNAREAIAVFGAGVARVALRAERTMLLLRLGARGSLLFAPGGRVYHAKACRLGEPLDTTGAGDVFNAYFAAWLAEGRPLEEALVAATTAAALKVLRRGAQAAPERSEVEEAMGRCRGVVARVEPAEAERMLAEML